MSTDIEANYDLLLKQAQEHVARIEGVASQCTDIAIQLIVILFQCEDAEVRSRVAEGMRLFLNEQLLQMQSK